LKATITAIGGADAGPNLTIQFSDPNVVKELEAIMDEFDLRKRSHNNKKKKKTGNSKEHEKSAGLPESFHLSLGYFIPEVRGNDSEKKKIRTVRCIAYICRLESVDSIFALREMLYSRNLLLFVAARDRRCCRV
jgi:hypothetical protein